ncbi:MAG: hypothetical protein MASP_01628 [Candidatus Methanolliviera sp. GoM_asphalt]|nr:MAG: hypothetical protein MASP_01628 [Candidatus Methanolliviera sp. GoM_asphalt]
MISPDPTNRKVLNKLFDVNKVLLKECGSVYGGIMIFHPYRIRGVVDDDILIEGIRWSEIRKKENWRDYVYPSPHIHAFVVSHFITAGDEIYEKSGFVMKRITKPGSKVSIGNLYDLCRAVTYCLSHCAVYPGERIKTTRWFGDLASFTSNSDKVKRDVYEAFVKARKRLGDAPRPRLRPRGRGRGEGEREAIKCKKCGGNLIPISKVWDYLRDPEWCAKAEHSELLRSVAEMMRSQGYFDNSVVIPPPLPSHHVQDEKSRVRLIR